MNEHFVNIKVDREERPDVDSIYMEAVVALTGSGGWPLTVFLTPDGEPFFGGTYFPPDAAPRACASFRDMLADGRRASGATSASEIDEVGASSLTEHLRRSAEVDAGRRRGRARRGAAVRRRSRA